MSPSRRSPGKLTGKNNFNSLRLLRSGEAALDQLDAVHGIGNVRVRGRRTTCHTYRDRSLRKPVLECLNLAVNRAVFDGVAGQESLGPVDVVGWDARHVGDLDEVARVGGVPSPHHKEHVDALLINQVMDCILTLLRGVADSVKLHVVLVHLVRSVLLHHRPLQCLADGLGLLLVHRGLVRETELAQVDVRVEALGDRILELLHELSLVSAIEHVVDDVLRLRHVLDDDVVLGERRGSNRLLVRPRAVDDAGHALTGVHVHRVPDLADPRARGIDDLHATVGEHAHLLKGGAESGKDHHVVVADLAEVLDAVDNRDELDAHVSHLLVHARVVDDLVGDVDGLVPVVHLGLDGHLHGSFHSPAESEVLGKAEGDVSLLHRVVVGAHGLDEVRLELVEHFLLGIGPSLLEPVPVERLLALNLLELLALRGGLRGLRSHRERGAHEVSARGARSNAWQRSTGGGKGGTHAGRGFWHEANDQANRRDGGESGEGDGEAIGVSASSQHRAGLFGYCIA
mmetsp:Transcript_29958/g.58557  ORF Transcript_29958/g.58557 Transcript_29958/m.58557 type:complete len:513 (-) Transcript_29958:18-1556(-)